MMNVWIQAPPISVMNFQGKFKAELSGLHIKLADYDPSLAQGWEGAPLKEKLQGESRLSVVIHTDFFGRA